MSEAESYNPALNSAYGKHYRSGPPQHISASALFMVVRGHENMTPLIHSFPLPSTKTGNGLCHFYETVNRHTAHFLTTVSGKELPVSIEDVKGRSVCQFTAFFTPHMSSQADSREDGPLIVGAGIQWMDMALPQ